MAAQNHKTVISPSPILGLNVQDSLVAMDSKYATVMSNFFSQPYGLQVRLGNVRHSTGLGGPVQTLVSHRTADYTNTATKVFAFADTLSGKFMYNVTTPGNQARVPVVVPGAALNTAKWEGIGISNASGYNTILFSGSDEPIRLDNLGNPTRISYAPGTPVGSQIAGVNPALLTGGCLHQKRMWMIQKDSTKSWYLDPEAIFGQAYSFDFGAVFTKGGKLVALASWTLDSGIGPDDYLVAISSRGEIALYVGPDPSSISTFQLKGVFYTGSPLSPRAITTVAGDLLILTQFGLLSMNAAMATSDTADAQSSAYLSQKIQYLISTLAARLPDQFGWDVVNWPDNNMIIVNVPKGGGTYDAIPTVELMIDEEAPSPYNGSGQLVQSTITKGWAQWDNMDALCWVVNDRVLMYGDSAGNVWRAWEGHTDGAIQVDSTPGSIVEGDAITAQCQTAFNYFGSETSVKHAKMVRPIFIGNSRVPYSVIVNPDFEYDSTSSSGAASSNVGSLWDRGKWDDAKWKGSIRTQKLWNAVSGIGTAFALRLAFNTAAPVLWAAYDFMYEDGRNI